MTRSNDGREIAVFLLDTQGWHDDQTSSQDNAMVFSLSVLLSSVVIFNAEKRIGEDDLRFLQCFSSHAKLLEEENQEEPFQKLVMLIRDWQFKDLKCGYYDDYTTINPNTSQHIDAKEVREIIQATYNDISAFLMPYPGSGVMSDHFDSKTKRFKRQRILKTRKRIHRNFVHLMTLAQKWVEDFKFTTYSGIGSSHDDMTYFMALQTALDGFDERIKKMLKDCKEIQEL